MYCLFEFQLCIFIVFKQGLTNIIKIEGILVFKVSVENLK